ncbi:hypothetical protein Rsub_01558 [Raphidocelis subcapitata]|uniref:HAMP domain-containing protein n=1 Tax=Raphidocelis subcapitata TaxID=307507 RepID=A0A2V0NN89_9CHLO|nr:hypothetical protein Rsub_01558 [Raphidocelis subcapitata]|eukprot:GBF88659.1 hypothetical protein Rsub_01558 [Raphidocelis subcapitata]
MAHRALVARVEAVMDEYYELCRAAEAARAEELGAAVALQAAWRGRLQRQQLRQLGRTSLTIQRFWRGHHGRLRAAAAREERDRRLRAEHFRRAATEIQRRWRGYWSRTRVHSLAARRAFLSAVAAASAAARAAAAGARDAALEAERGGRAAAARRAFEGALGRLHHLVSTRAAPGVFSPPFEAAAGLLPLVEGLTIEEHLQRACREQVVPEVQRRLREAASPPRAPRPLRPLPQAAALAASAAARSAEGADGGPRWRPGVRVTGSGGGAGAAAAGAAAAGAVAAAAAGASPASTTLRQSVPFDAVDDAADLERRIDRAQIAVLHRQPFLPPSGRINAPFIEGATVRASDAFRDPVPGIPGTRASAAAAAAAAACRGATGRLFDASGRRRGFFDPGLRQGY